MQHTSKRWCRSLRCARLPVLTVITVGLVVYAYTVLVYGFSANVVRWPLHLKINMAILLGVSGLLSMVVLLWTAAPSRRRML